MELRQLQYFVAIAEHESFRRASEDLVIAQPALSAQIAKLESELGLALFERVGRGVRLTDPGRLVLLEARRALAAADAVIGMARAGAQGAVGSLRIGYSRIFPFRDMTRILRAFRKRRPQIVLDLAEYPSEEQLRLLRAGELDCALVRLPEDLDDDELVSYPVVLVRSMVALPREHRLAKRRTIPLRELADEDWVALARQVEISFRDHFVALCRSAGFTPRITQETNDVRIIYGFVAAGLGVAMASSAGRDLGVRRVQFIATSPDFTFRFYAVTRRAANAPALAALVAEIQTAARI
jgi:DNA-binding transcriptional LysR family regulator